MARGSIRKRRLADGAAVYDVVFDVPGSPGARHQRRKTLPTRKAAERYLTTQLAAIERGDIRYATTETVGEYLARWLRDHRRRIEASTAAAYDESIRLRIVPHLGDVRLRDLTRNHVREMVTDLAAGGRYAAKTINNTITVLRCALGHAQDDGLIAGNPAIGRGRRDRLKLPADHREMDFLRPEEIPAYLAGCSQGYRPIAELLVGTGCRIGEALALTWDDVDWRSSAIYVRRSVKVGGAVGSTKSDRARRVEIGPRLLGVLRDLYAVRSEHAAEAPPLIFPGPDGGIRDRGDVSKRLHRDALRRCGIRQTIRLHDLRHSAAAAWLAAGLPLIYVQRQLGHSTIATTEQHYGHLAESFVRDAAERAEAIVWRGLPAVSE